MSIQNPQGTDGRVYGGDCDLIHVPDGTRATHGKQAADFIDRNMRQAAFTSGMRTKAQSETQDLCPGCYMVVLVNTALELAKRTGQSTREMGKALSAAFELIAACDGDPDCIEEIRIRLDTIGERSGVPQPKVAEAA